MTTGFTTGTIVGDARQRDRRAVLRVGDRQVVELGDVLARGLRQAQLDVDLLAVGRGPVGGDVAVDVGAQARGELHRRQAELAHGVGLEAHRVGGQAGLDRGRRGRRCRAPSRPRACSLQDLGLEHGRIGAEQRDEDRPVAERDLDARGSARAPCGSPSRPRAGCSFRSCGLTSWMRAGPPSCAGRCRCRRWSSRPSGSRASCGRRPRPGAACRCRAPGWCRPAASRSCGCSCRRSRGMNSVPTSGAIAIATTKLATPARSDDARAA